MRPLPWRPGTLALLTVASAQRRWSEGPRRENVMQWDLGLQGLTVLGALSLGFGVLAGLLVGRGWTRRLWAAAITTVGCFGVGLLTSEWLFGWATEEELQP